MSRLLVYLAVCCCLMPVQAVAVALGARLSRTLPVSFHRFCARLLGFDIVVRGRLPESGPVLFVGNHTSYLDIMVLGSIIEGSFVAKSEVARWPLFGTLARLQRTVFIERRASRSVRQRDEISARLAAGDSLILFPEGTSDDGNRVLPFKSALFAVVEKPVAGAPVWVQPFSIAYTGLDGLPLGREWRPLFSWYGDMGLPGHIWRVLTLNRTRVEVTFHQAVTFGQYGSRKALAEHCFEVVRAGVADANAGHGARAAAA
ncbi:MAG: lysophospholipid acyltransferase family protein [Alphaproteobacteria bacterium]|nr:lysophospholipid acyltransferase family protein [Alphaproteobacteria bacterium]